MNAVAILNVDIDTEAPIVGVGATVFGPIDRLAYTVIAVSASGKTATLQRDRSTLLNGAFSGEDDALVYNRGWLPGYLGVQRYSYEADPSGQTIRVSRRKNGEWKTTGPDGVVVRFGFRAEYIDFNF